MKTSKKTPEEESQLRIRSQYLGIKRGVGDAIALFRVGDFLEAYYEDAEILAQTCGIRTMRLGKSRRLMAGFPAHASAPYIERLTDAGYRVAVCEQVEGGPHEPSDAAP